MKTHGNRRRSRRGTMLAVVVAMLFACATVGGTASTASAYSCTPFSGYSLCTYYDGQVGATIFEVGLLHSLVYSYATNDATPYNRTVYTDITGQACGCILVSNQGSYSVGAGLGSPTPGYPRAMLRYEAGGLLAQEQY